MQREVRKLLIDVKDACELIQQFVKRKEFADYLGDPLLRSGVERQFTIIGEALNKSLRIDPGLEESITDVRRIVNFRNILTHGYGSISDETVWGIVQRYLPRLHKEVSNLLTNVKDNPRK